MSLNSFPIDKQKLLDIVKQYAVPMVVALLSALIGAVSAYLGIPTKVEVKVVEQSPPFPLAVLSDPSEPIQTFGWVPDPNAVKQVVTSQQIPDFADTPAGKVVQGDQEAFLWRTVRECNPSKPSTWYPNVNQRDVGCCVGCGFKHCVDVLQAVQIRQDHPAEWKPVSVEAIYGGSRVEIGGGGISGDGSVGAWAFKAVQTLGNLSMEKHGQYDLSEFSPSRARDWGRRGIPDDLEATSRQSLVKGGAMVRSWADVKKAIQQGYPVAVCSDQGFTMTRDGDGFARTQGKWMHCMAVIGVRSGSREGGFILNSWGDSAHTGPVWPADAPVAGFWADADTIDRMVRQGDSFALSDVVGFPARRIDWFAHNKPTTVPLAASTPLTAPEFALAP